MFASARGLKQDERMPVIRFAKTDREIVVEKGANLMKALLSAGLPVASSCLGDGICGKCRIYIIEGFENLTPMNAVETILRDRLKVPREQRISCQSEIIGDIRVDASYW